MKREQEPGIADEIDEQGASDLEPKAALKFRGTSLFYRGR